MYVRPESDARLVGRARRATGRHSRSWSAGTSGRPTRSRWRSWRSAGCGGCRAGLRSSRRWSGWTTAGIRRRSARGCDRSCGTGRGPSAGGRSCGRRRLDGGLQGVVAGRPGTGPGRGGAEGPAPERARDADGHTAVGRADARSGGIQAPGDRGGAGHSRRVRCARTCSSRAARCAIGWAEQTTGELPMDERIDLTALSWTRGAASCWWQRSWRMRCRSWRGVRRRT
jgi:hypothetical protein